MILHFQINNQTKVANPRPRVPLFASLFAAADSRFSDSKMAV